MGGLAFHLGFDGYIEFYHVKKRLQAKKETLSMGLSQKVG